MTKPTIYYKWLMANGTTPQTGDSEWKLPKGKRPGAWREVKGDLVPCEHGLHVMTRKQAIEWGGEVLYEIEVDGECVDAGDKHVCRRARLVSEVGRWTDRTAREFACDCAERALDREDAAGRKVDPRSREAVAVARRYARGEATGEEMDAAWDAAGSASWDAAGSASWDAAGSAAGSAARSAAGSAAGSASWDASWDAAWSAAWDAAGSAARSAAWDAARSAAWDAAWDASWDAAWSAAWDAAGSAARSAAWDAARSAAWDAAWSAARSAAWDAEREWQTDRMFAVLGAKP